MTTGAEVASVADVLITSELARRPKRLPNYEAENDALVALATAMTESPASVLQKLADCALVLCRAGSAGVSVWEREGDVFRWRATAGVYEPYLGATLPRYFSPCGTVLDRNASLLMAEPERIFPYIAELCAPVREVLLVPFHQEGIAIGTVWVVAHDDERQFDAEDARVVTSLTKLASAAVATLNRIEAAERAESARREREEHFRALVLATSDVVYRMSADWEEMLPLEGRGLVASNQKPIRGWLEANLPAVEHKRVRAAVERAIASKGPFELEHQVIRPDGTLGWTFSRALPVSDAAGAVTGWLGVATDVTRRKQAEEALREESSKKDDFIAVLAHELRNPLAPISTGIGLLSTLRGPTETARTLAVMQRQVQHMVRLIDDLMDVSRITQGKLDLRRDNVTVDQMFDVAVEACELNLARGKHTLRRAPIDELYLHADPTRIAQIIGNLLNNACKYTPDHGVIELAAHRSGNDVVITVRDTGIGIPKEQLGDVFNMFSQVNRALDRAQGGLGIGLALVHRLVVLHGGSVSASSGGPGLGSTFTVRLPLAPGGALRESSVEVRGAPIPLERVSRILIVDDNDDAAELLTLVLENEGYEVLVARDGPEAIASADAAMPAVILLDIGLPGMSGYEVATHLREDERFDNTVLIALTGWGSEQDRQRAMSAGFDLHLTKPVASDELRYALTRARTVRSARPARVSGD